MHARHVLPRSAIPALAGALTFGLSLLPSPASAQMTIACVSKGLGLVRIVDDESRCKRWETVRFLGGGAGVKFVFVTSALYDGSIPSESCPGCTTGVERATFECNRLASDAKLPGDYVPWLSDSDTNAVDRLPEDGGPWFNVKGELVAASLAGLVNTGEDPGNVDLYNAIRYDELGADQASAFVWTGTDRTGTHTASCNDWSPAELESGGVGQADLATFEWTDFQQAACFDPRNLYCFQE